MGWEYGVGDCESRIGGNSCKLVKLNFYSFFCFSLKKI